MIGQSFLQQKRDTTVKLDEYISDLNLEISQDGYSCKPMHKDGFAYMWAGVKASYGVRRGKVCYEVKIMENLEVSTSEFTDAHIVRVGWSTDAATLQLGEDKNSFGYGGTAKKSEGRKFSDYGRRFDTGDVVGCYLSIASGWVDISYCVNGYQCGTAYKVRWDTDEALFPHILTKNCRVEVNFGQAHNPYFSIMPGYKLIGNLPADLRVPVVPAPITKQDCEIIMMVGLPGVGKTTWAMNYAKLHPNKKYNILGTDAIIDKMRVQGLPRKDNFGGRWDVLIKQASECFNIMLRKASTCKRNLILDQTNVYASARKRKVRQYKDAGYTVNSMVLVPTDDDMISRSTQRTLKEGKEVPEAAVYDMKANFSLPHEDENLFSTITFLELQREDAESLVLQYNIDASLKGYKSNKQAGHGPNENQKEISEKRQTGDISKDVLKHDRQSHPVESTTKSRVRDGPRDTRSLRESRHGGSRSRDGSHENTQSRRSEERRTGRDRRRSTSRGRDQRSRNSGSGYRDRSERRSDDVRRDSYPRTERSDRPTSDIEQDTRSRDRGRSSRNEAQRDVSRSRERRFQNERENENLHNDRDSFHDRRDRDLHITQQDAHYFRSDGSPGGKNIPVANKEQPAATSGRYESPKMHWNNSNSGWNKDQPSGDFDGPPIKHHRQEQQPTQMTRQSDDPRENYMSQDNQHKLDPFAPNQGMEHLRGQGMPYEWQMKNPGPGNLNEPVRHMEENWGRFQPENQGMSGMQDPARRPQRNNPREHTGDPSQYQPERDPNQPFMEGYSETPHGPGLGPNSFPNRDQFGGFDGNWHQSAPNFDQGGVISNDQPPHAQHVQYGDNMWDHGEGQGHGFGEDHYHEENPAPEQFVDSYHSGFHSHDFGDIHHREDEPPHDANMSHQQGAFPRKPMKLDIERRRGFERDTGFEGMQQKQNSQTPCKEQSFYEALSPKLMGVDFESLKATLANVQQAQQEEIRPLLNSMKNRQGLGFADPTIPAHFYPPMITEQSREPQAPSNRPGPSQDDSGFVPHNIPDSRRKVNERPDRPTSPKLGRGAEDKPRRRDDRRQSERGSRSERETRHDRRDRDRGDDRSEKYHRRRSQSPDRKLKGVRERSPRDSRPRSPRDSRPRSPRADRSSSHRRSEERRYRPDKEPNDRKESRRSPPRRRGPLLETPSLASLENPGDLQENSRNPDDPLRLKRPEECGPLSRRVASDMPPEGYAAEAEPLPLDAIDDWNQLQAVELLIKDHLQPKLRDEQQQRPQPETKQGLLGPHPLSPEGRFHQDMMHEVMIPEDQLAIENFPVRHPRQRPPFMRMPGMRPIGLRPGFRPVRPGHRHFGPVRPRGAPPRMIADGMPPGPPMRRPEENLTDQNIDELLGVPPRGARPMRPRPPMPMRLQEPQHRGPGPHRPPLVRFRSMEPRGQRAPRPRGPWEGPRQMRPRLVRPLIRR